QSGGVFVKIRVIDFYRSLNYDGLLLSIEKDINRTAFVGLICFSNGFYSYILLSSFMNKLGMMINGFKNYYLLNSSSFLINVPTGTFIHNIELIPGKGGIISRAAVCSSFLDRKST